MASGPPSTYKQPDVRGEGEARHMQHVRETGWSGPTPLPAVENERVKREQNSSEFLVFPPHFLLHLPFHFPH